jgi:hypothetical protein
VQCKGSGGSYQSACHRFTRTVVVVVVVVAAVSHHCHRTEVDTASGTGRSRGVAFVSVP